MTSHLQDLYWFTKFLVEGALRQARSGKKDEARNTLRYVRNAKIVQILRAGNLPDWAWCDVFHLEWQLRELESDCHPLNVSDNTDSLSSIARSLQLIAGQTAKLLTLAGGVPIRFARDGHATSTLPATQEFPFVVGLNGNGRVPCPGHCHCGEPHSRWHQTTAAN